MRGHVDTRVSLTPIHLYTPLQINLLRSDLYRTEFGAIYLGPAISIIPIVIFFCIMSRYIISGLTLGGVKE
jgi:multiple sugar transport system permease protein